MADRAGKGEGKIKGEGKGKGKGKCKKHNIAKYQKMINAVLEKKATVEPLLSAKTTEDKKRVAQQRDRIENIMPSQIQNIDKILELHQQISADLPEVEKRVAKTKIQ